MSDSELDTAVRDRLARGEVLVSTEPVSGSPVPAVKLQAMIDTPPERVWRLIDGCADYQRTMPNVSASQELSRKGDLVRVRITVGMPFPLPNLVSVTDGVHTVIPGEKYQREWQLVEGDYKHNAGSWTLTPFCGDPARTLVRYRVHAVPKIPIPQKIQQLAQKKALPKMIEQLRRLARGL